jgi:mono/diheme cytochrome c family protein
MAVALLVVAAVAGVLLSNCDAQAGWFGHWGKHGCGPDGCVAEGPPIDNLGGTWYWLHSPEDEKRIAMGLFNRYCIRCHGVNGRGVWDIPGIPDFTNVRWQECRSDAQIARIILEGRGAIMPSFRGAVSLEEAWALARHLRTFAPGTEKARPDAGSGAANQPKAP